MQRNIFVAVQLYSLVFTSNSFKVFPITFLIKLRMEVISVQNLKNVVAIVCMRVKYDRGDTGYGIT